MPRRWLTGLPLAYGLLVLYGSLMPYDLSGDWEAASGRFRAALSFQQGPIGQPFSRTDLLSNLLLYMPFGLLLATRRRARGGSGAGAALWALVLGAMLSALVETLQLFSASRVSGLQDLAANSAGALVGGIVGAAWGMHMLIRAEGGVRRRWIDRPVELAAILLLAAMAGDALFPYWPTLDVAEVWGNLKRSTFSLSSGLALHPWHYWLVKRVGVYAVLTVLLAVWAGGSARARWTRGALGAVAFAAAAEMARLFITSGSTNVANLAAAAGGAVVGAATGAMFRRRLSLGDKLILAWLLIAAYVIYWEWGFLEFEWSRDALAEKLPCGAEWLPLYSYAMGGRVLDVWNFVSTIVLLAAMAMIGRTWSDAVGYRGAWSTPARAAIWAGLFGLALELGQFLIPGRHPSPTDVLCFALGAGLGSALAGARNRRLRLAKASAASTANRKTPAAGR